MRFVVWSCPILIFFYIKADSFFLNLQYNHFPMANFQINILGCGSATPSMKHLPSSQIIDFRNNLFMIDCGECAQLTMRRMKLKFSRLNHIFISHLHGDHCFGLLGLISTLALHEKQSALTIHIHAEGAKLFKQMVDFFCRDLPFELNFNIIEQGKTQMLFENNSLTVTAFPLYHRVPCSGFIFQEKPKMRHIRGEMVKFYNIPVRCIHDIKNGADYVTPEGQVIENSRLTTDADPVMSYAYCSDTLFDPRVAQAVTGVNTIYHEATYVDDDHALAIARGHSTAREAAIIAREAQAQRLIIGHYSKRYTDEETLLKQALEEFPSVILANEQLRVDLL